MNILLFKGQSRYDALRHFTDDLSDALRKNGHTIYLIDAMINGWEAGLNDILNKSKIDLAIDFNGITSQIKVGEQSMYDTLKIYYLAIYVDHPAYHMQRLCVPNMHYLSSFIDKNHVEFVQNVIPDSQKVKFFLPHAGKSVSKIKKIKDFCTLKSIDLLFTGSRPSLEKSWEKSSPNIIKKMLNEMSDLLDEDIDLSLEDIFKRVNLSENLLLSPIAKAQHAKYLQLFISYFRAKKRDLLIKALCESGLNITVCGSGWEELAKEHDNVTYKGMVNMDENLKLISQAKILIHNNIDFSRGSHERVFNAMLNNTLVFSDKSEYYDEFFTPNEDIIYYNFSSLKEDMQKLKPLLDDDELLFKMTQKPKSICEQHHTWDSRVKIIEDVYEYAKLLDQ